MPKGASRGYGSKASGKASSSFYSNIFTSISPENDKNKPRELQKQAAHSPSVLKPSNTISLPLRTVAAPVVTESRQPGASTLAFRPKNQSCDETTSNSCPQDTKKPAKTTKQPSSRDQEQKASDAPQNQLAKEATLPTRRKPSKSATEKPIKTSRKLATSVPLRSLSEQNRHVSPIFPLIQHDENRCIKSYSDFSSFVRDNGSARKIAEAGFGEVYQISVSDPDDKDAPPEESVFKVLPLRRQTVDARTRSKWTQEQHDKYEREIYEYTALKDALSEIKILMNLSPIVGFVDFKEIHVLRGRADDYWSKIWRDFEEKQKEKSTFPDPSAQDGWADDQLFLAIEMVYAGEPVSKLLSSLNTVWAVWDILWGVLLAIGRAEEHFEFEHRDLHVGNICVKSSTDSQTALNELPVRDYTKDLGFTDLEVTILDYGLSRIKLDVDTSAKRGNDVIYTKLDEWIFEGNSAESRQYAIYRYMRSVMFFDDPQADYESRIDEVGRSRKTWRGFYPLTTVIWLCFLVEKMEAHIKWPSESAANEKYNMQNVKILAPEEKELARKKMLLIESRLKELFGMLTIKNVPTDDVYSAASIVDWAEREGWIAEAINLSSSEASSLECSSINSDSS
jgi:serine/threonine-protein kinase haspin